MKKFFYVIAALGLIGLILIGFISAGKEVETVSNLNIPRKSSGSIADLLNIIGGRLHSAKVPSESMEDTIMAGETIVFDRRAYSAKLPERFDVVIFKCPDDESIDYVKRIIGLPRETIEIRGGQVYIDSIPLEEPFLKEEQTGEFDSYEIGENSYFIMGDNRTVSFDSRAWINKCVPYENIMGKVVFILEKQ